MIYDRRIMIEILIYHCRMENASCRCGWNKLGASHAEHVADAYETAIRAIRGDR